MIETLISSKTRIKLLLKFFLNNKVQPNSRQLEVEFGASSIAIPMELNHLEKVGLLIAHHEGYNGYFQANDHHYLYDIIHRLVKKYIWVDLLIIAIIKKL